MASQNSSVINADLPLLPLVEAVSLATGQRRSIQTILRWSQKPNQHGINLQTWKLGGKRLTTIVAVRDYVHATTQAADRNAIPEATPKQTSIAHDRAMKMLEAEGI